MVLSSWEQQPLPTPSRVPKRTSVRGFCLQLLCSSDQNASGKVAIPTGEEKKKTGAGGREGDIGLSICCRELLIWKKFWKKWNGASSEGSEGFPLSSGELGIHTKISVSGFLTKNCLWIADFKLQIEGGFYLKNWFVHHTATKKTHRNKPKQEHILLPLPSVKTVAPNPHCRIK